MTHQAVNTLSFRLQFHNLIYLISSNTMPIQDLPELGASQKMCPHATAATFIITKQNFQARASFWVPSLDFSSNLINTESDFP